MGREFKIIIEENGNVFAIKHIKKPKSIYVMQQLPVELAQQLRIINGTLNKELRAML